MTQHITIPRATIEQAIEALKRSHPISNSNRDLNSHSEVLSALKEALK